MPTSRAWRMRLLVFSTFPLFAVILASALACPRPAVAAAAVGAPCTEAQLDAALAGGGAVTFNCGGPVTITFSSEKLITLPTTLDGANGGLGLVTFSGGGSVRLFHVAAGAQLTLVNGLALVAGSAPAQGGAILAETGANLFVADARFEGNQAVSSGGALALAGESLISRSTFINNSSLKNGGAISNSAALFVAQSSFASNQAQQGGALYTTAPLTVTQSAFSANSAVNNGGAIVVDPSARLTLRASEFSGHAGQQGITLYAGGPVDIAGSTFHDNGSENQGTGGAIETWSRLDVLNSTFSQNHAHLGGAIQLQSGLVQITNTTFVSNTAGAAGPNGGNIGVISLDLTPSLRILNSVLAGGIPNNCSAALASLGGNAEDANSCGFTQPGDQPGIDPRLAPLLLSAGAPGALALTHMPLPGSPLVDAARLAGCPPVDQRGRYRPSGAGCDVGAVEVTQPMWLPLIRR